MSTLTSVPVPTRFASLFTNLVISDAERKIARIEPTTALSEDDVAYLLSTASRFALTFDVSDEQKAQYCHYAYEVATRISEIPGSGDLFSAISEMILGRLGNFPARRLLRDKLGRAAESIDPFIATELLVRESENRYNADPNSPILTDFQVRLLSALSQKRIVSVSAPTSAGKSFTLEIDLLRRISQKADFVAIFLVPTRALIRQVSLDLIALMRQNNIDVNVVSAPTVALSDEGSTSRTIYVFTQERLATLLQTVPAHFHVDAFIVDEAQEVAKGERGQTLERALRAALELFPDSSIFFSSPLRSNPAFLVDLFGGHESTSEHFIEHQAPVTQNFIVLKTVTGAPKKVRVSVLVDGSERLLQDRDVPFKFRGNCLGRVAHHFTETTDTSIVFCNRPSAADKVAKQIYEDVGTDLDDPTLDDFASFLSTEVHHLYRLSEYVRRGVAFHYANIPQIVRARIEELVRERKIRFICCTSTLLQGVNLPAKNIFVENPKSGRGRAMEPGDFWNLVGRAGRMNQEFIGNVFKVYTKDWDDDPAAGERLVSIESAFQVAVEERTPQLAFLCKEVPVSSESEERWAEQAFASLYARFISSGERLSQRIQDGPNHPAALEIDSYCEAFRANEQTLPDELFHRNFYVHPQRLEKLAAFLRSQPWIQGWQPLPPQNRSAYDRLVAIFEKLEEIFIQEGTRRHIYFAVLASQWMQGKPLRELVQDRLDRKGATHDAEKANDEIRGLFEDLEERIRYIYVKYMGIYNSVLSAVMREMGFPDDAESLVPLHLFLEFGASSKTLINFMSLGLSRTSAILLQNFAKFRDDLEIPMCRTYIERINLDRTPLPAICKSEISRVRGH